MSKLHRHIDPSPEYEATATYNFVPLPEQVLTVADPEASTQPWRQHHRILPDHHTGHLNIKLTTLTPLFTRGAAVRRDNGAWDNRKARQRPESLTAADGRTPIIAGASLRGAVRTLFEILTFSKLDPATNQPSFYRSVGNDRIGKIYRSEVTPAASVGADEKPQPGFMARNGLQWVIQPAESARVSHRLLTETFGSEFQYRQHPTYVPNDRLHRRRVFVRLDDKGFNVTHLASGEEPGYRRADLVLTGGAPKKKREFVFFPPSPGESIPVPDGLVESFNSEQQISQWQKKRFTSDPHNHQQRLLDGGLVAGEPVFYVLGPSDGDSGGGPNLKFFGRAQMFRMPYGRSPAEMLPKDHADAGLDMAQAVFGTVADDLQIKGRVSFSSAVASADSEPPGSWYERPFVPKMLAAPKATAYPNYLTQNGAAGIEGQTTYHNVDQGTIRGHKLYWHRPTADPLHLAADANQALRKAIAEDAATGLMHTVIAPVKQDVSMRAKVRFSNLTAAELGALLSAVKLPGGCAHRLGMAKSLGLGSVRIDLEGVSLVNPAQRYAAATETADENDTAQILNQCTEAFHRLIDSHAADSGEPIAINPTPTAATPLAQFARIEALYTLCSYEDAPDPDDTEAMTLKQFGRRLVLPTPQQVTGQRSPDVPDDRRPFAGRTPSSRKRGREGPGNDGGRHGRGRRRTIPSGPPKPVEMTIADRTTKKGAPIVVDDDGAWFVFSPGTPPPEEASAGSRVRVTIKTRGTGPGATGQVVYTPAPND